MELDHIVIAVTDLAAAARELEVRHGLGSIEGGRHPGWGTANRIVPLGDTYLELIAVIDAAEAAGTIFGRWVASGASELGRPLGWAARTHELDVIAQRLGLDIGAGSRATPGGQMLTWRSAGIEQAAMEPSLPFFIEWGRETRFPGQIAVTHRADPSGISKIVLDGDPVRLTSWLGDHALQLVVRPGAPRVAAVVVSGSAGEIVFGDA
jgi:hypothetical protein